MMQFFLPMAGDKLRVIRDIDVRLPFTYHNKNWDVFVDITPEVRGLDGAALHDWRWRGPGRELEEFTATLPADIVCTVSQVYIRKNGWYNNSIVLLFNKDQPQPFTSRSIRIFIHSFEQIEFAPVELKQRR